VAKGKFVSYLRVSTDKQTSAARAQRTAFPKLGSGSECAREGVDRLRRGVAPRGRQSMYRLAVRSPSRIRSRCWRSALPAPASLRSSAGASANCWNAKNWWTSSRVGTVRSPALRLPSIARAPASKSSNGFYPGEQTHNWHRDMLRQRTLEICTCTCPDTVPARTE
jgi:hypothetical protein